MEAVQEQTAEERIEAWIAKHDASMSAAFIPWSQSRNKDEEQPTLNWSVTIKTGKRDVLTIDYSAGCAHCPSYKHETYNRTFGRQAVNDECEKGHESRRPANKITPDFKDVLYSLSMDSNAINAGSFENWAADYGYDEDNRKAETIYRACLDIYTRLRAGFGPEALEELAEACQDY